MSRVFWDILIDCNSYRVFTTGWEVDKRLEFGKVLKVGDSFGEQWVSIRLELWIDPDHPQKERRKPPADFMSAGIMEVITHRARLILEPMVTGQVEFLPCETPVGPYYGLHVRYVDCLDVERAQVFRFKSSGRIMQVEKYAFHWERLEGIHIFRLPELGLSRLFVSDEFKRVVEENGLTGLEFYPVPLVEE